MADANVDVDANTDDDVNVNADAASRSSSNSMERCSMNENRSLVFESNKGILTSLGSKWEALFQEKPKTVSVDK